MIKTKWEALPPIFAIQVTMKNKLKIVLALALILLAAVLPACQKSGQKPEKFTEYSFDYFDTVTSITGYAESRDAFDETVGYILDELGEYHRLFNIYFRYEGMENLRTVNELSGGAHRTVKVDRKIIDMLLYAKEMYAVTGGQMNIAMGSVLSVWHEYRTEGLDEPETAKLPPLARLQDAAEHTDIDALVIDEENLTVTLTDPETTLDVGAVAKGYAVEMIARGLEARGVSGYVLNVGGNVRTIGKKPDGAGWTVGIEDPLGDGYIAYLSVAGESVVTSGSYQRYYIVNGKRYHHIIDPETLMPAEYFVSVSVLTKNSAEGDVLSTALFCMPLDEGLALVESLSGVEAHWVLPDGTRRASSGWNGFTVEK